MRQGLRRPGRPQCGRAGGARHKGLAGAHERVGELPGTHTIHNQPQHCTHQTSFCLPLGSDPIVGFPPVREDLQRWAQRGKCLTTGPSDPSLFRRGRFSNEIICATELGESSVELVVREDGTHAWFEETEFDTSEYAWSFMMRAANVTQQPGGRGRPLLDGQLRSQRVRASEKASEGMRRFREAIVQPEPFLLV